MLDSNDEILISVYKNTERVYLLKTRFRKILFLIFVSLFILILGISFFLLYLFRDNKANQAFNSSITYTKPTINIQNLELKNTDNFLNVFFDLYYKDNLNLKIIVFGESGNKIVAQKPLFNLSGIFLNNQCKQGENIILEAKTTKSMKFVIPYDESIKSFERIAIFICDKNNIISNFYKEINITDWSNKNAVQ